MSVLWLQGIRTQKRVLIVIQTFSTKYWQCGFILFCFVTLTRTHVSRAVTIRREKLKMRQTKSIVPKIYKRPVHLCLLKSKVCLLNLTTWLVFIIVCCPCFCCSPWIHFFCINNFLAAWSWWTKMTIFLWGNLALPGTCSGLKSHHPGCTYGSLLIGYFRTAVSGLLAGFSSCSNDLREWKH